MKSLFFSILFLIILNIHALFAQGATWSGGSIIIVGTNNGNITIGNPPPHPLYNNISGLLSNTEVNGKTFFVGDVPANASDYEALGAPATTIVDCPDAAALTGASLFIEDEESVLSMTPHYYYRLACIAGKNASGQTLHLKPHEVICIKLDVPQYLQCAGWLAENPSQGLQQFKGLWFLPLNDCGFYYQATSAGTVTLNFALIGYGGLGGFQEMLDDSVTFTIQVDE